MRGRIRRCLTHWGRAVSRIAQLVGLIRQSIAATNLLMNASRA